MTSTSTPQVSGPGPAIKICGLTRLYDLLLAGELGAWAVGFVFAAGPRRLTPAAARRLVEGLAAATQGPWTSAEGAASGASASGRQGATAGRSTPPLTVGVFGDVSADEIARVVSEVGLDAVQLHAAEGPSGDVVREALAEVGRSAIIIQAVPVDPRETEAATLRRAVTRARRQADIVLLDTQMGDRFGGTGRALPWSLVGEAGLGEVFVAGGIGPENVEAALDESGAWGIDVSSGVECSPGVKDAQLLRRLFARVDAAWRTAAVGCPAPGVHTGRSQRGPDS